MIPRFWNILLKSQRHNSPSHSGLDSGLCTAVMWCVSLCIIMSFITKAWMQTRHHTTWTKLNVCVYKWRICYLHHSCGKLTRTHSVYCLVYLTRSTHCLLHVCISLIYAHSLHFLVIIKTHFHFHFTSGYFAFPGKNTTWELFCYYRNQIPVVFF